jgi:two-component system CheB/CheR fusion protein
MEGDFAELSRGELEMDAEQTSDAKSLLHHNLDGPTHYVGIGASAGGLEAIETFFTSMRPDSGMAFIIVQHLSPDYKSLMVELLSKRTPMPVYRAEEGMSVAPNCVYLIPPKKNLTIFHGKLLLSDQDHSRGINLPIDLFLRSLAEDQGEAAVGIVLSGTGSDGMRGIRAIKESGGMVMVQEPESARFDGMPRSAISTGLADFILPPDQMPLQLLSYAQHPYVAKAERKQALITDEDGMTRIFALLREKTRVDFTYYKPSTVVRRIARRMTVNQIHEIPDYVRYMESYPGEIQALYRELLIGVTSFFRDREAFDLLGEKWLPHLLEGEHGGEIRFWVAGCSTGEEAYSLAILCREAMENIGRTRDVKIFATDIDRDAILNAGNGLFPESIAADLAPSYLAKYFQRKNECFQISRSIREMVVFAQHNLIKDPPFTNIDLISCRNLLIYLQPVLQRKALEFFNFSLKPRGVLFLGSSETTGEMADYFEPLSHRWKIYRSRGRRKPAGAAAEALSIAGPRSAAIRSRQVVGLRALRAQEEDRVFERLLQAVSGDYVPLALVVNDQMELIHVLGDTEGYLKVPAGKVQNDVSKMIAADLAIPVATGIQKYFKNREEIRYSNIRLKSSSGSRTVQMRIKPLPDKAGQEPLAVVFIEELASTGAGASSDSAQLYDVGRETQQRIDDLEQDLQFTKENLQATIEELETSNEELQATNEELLASNEELQSTNEELQSVNEELYTVNAEYQSKIMELTELSHDVDNLLASTRIATLFLDENLEIRKFTPEITQIYKVMDKDLGRPISHLSHRLVDTDPLEIIHSVHESAKPFERSVATVDGRWYLLRALPYHIGPQTFSGVVLTFIEITQLRKAERALKDSEERFRQVAELATDGIWDWKVGTDEEYLSPKLKAMLGYEDHELPNTRSTWRSLIFPEDLQRAFQAFKSHVEEGKTYSIPLRYKHRDGSTIWVLSRGVAIKGKDGRISRMIGMHTDITHIKSGTDSPHDGMSRDTRDERGDGHV